MSKIIESAPASRTGALNLVCGSGGSRAILGCAGAILACHLSGIRKWNTIGGSSGGSIAAILFASGMHPAEVARHAIEIDFSDMLTRHSSYLGLLRALIMKYRYDHTRPIKGVFSSEKMQAFINERVPTWPENFWTIAVVANSRYLFTAGGVYKCEIDGTHKLIAQAPPDAGAVIAGSCAVPGFIDAVPYQDVHLHDGAIGFDGRCPVSVLKDHFAYPPSSIVACDVGEDGIKNAAVIRTLWKLACSGGKCGTFNGTDPDTSGGVILLPAGPVGFHSLKFSLSANDKWQGLLAGFTGAIDPLTRAGLLSGNNLYLASFIRDLYQDLRSTRSGRKELADKMRRLLTNEGMFC